MHKKENLNLEVAKITLFSSNFYPLFLNKFFKALSMNNLHVEKLRFFLHGANLFALPFLIILLVRPYVRIRNLNVNTRCLYIPKIKLFGSSKFLDTKNMILPHFFVEDFKLLPDISFDVHILPETSRHLKNVSSCDYSRPRYIETEPTLLLHG